ncbi:NCA2-domain-containing protein, partial [Nadsonia fulvescens var. elongata DSM 6958]
MSLITKSVIELASNIDDVLDSIRFTLSSTDAITSLDQPKAGSNTVSKRTLNDNKDEISRLLALIQQTSPVIQLFGGSNLDNLSFHRLNSDLMQIISSPNGHSSETLSGADSTVQVEVSKQLLADSLNQESFKFESISLEKINCILNDYKSQYLLARTSTVDTSSLSPVESDLHWSFLNNVSLLSYLVVYNSLLKQNLPLSKSIYYWDGVLNSNNFYLAVHCLQFLPVNICNYIKTSSQEFKGKLSNIYSNGSSALHRGANIFENGGTRNTLCSTSKFTGTVNLLTSLIRKSYQDISQFIGDQVNLFDQKTRVLGKLLTLMKVHVKKSIKDNKMKKLTVLQNNQANCLGLMVNNIYCRQKHSQSLRIGNKGDRSDKVITILEGQYKEKRKTVANNIIILTTILTNLCSSEQTGFSTHEIYQQQKEGTLIDDSAIPKLVDDLQMIMDKLYVEQVNINDTNLSNFGKPSRVVRYWPACILGGVTMIYIKLRIFNNWQDIIQWFNDSILTTVRSFWQNWILDPMKKIIATIRHDETSRIAVVSKNSLEADMSSLERMVLEFAGDNKITLKDFESNTTESMGNADENTIIREMVQRGDITPVMKSYEQEMSSPLTSIIKGSLVRSLLIQVQKTKVDVEIAMSGIDKLLQSQELVIGIIAAMPSITISWYALTTILNVTQGKRMRGSNKRKSDNVGVLKRTFGKIERLIMSVSFNGTDHSQKADWYNTKLGLVLCEINLLRSLGKTLITNKEQQTEWNQDVLQIE